jgi:hypothetical protein
LYLQRAENAAAICICFIQTPPRKTLPRENTRENTRENGAMKLGVMHVKVLAGFLAGAGLALIGSYYAEHRRMGPEPVPATTPIAPAAPKAAAELHPAEAPTVTPPAPHPAQMPGIKIARGDAAPKLPRYTEPAVAEAALAASAEQPKPAEIPVSPPVVQETALDRPPEKPVEAALPTTSPATTPIEPSPEPSAPHSVTIPDGTVLRVRLGEALSTKRNRVGDTFPGTLDQELVADGFVIAERGAKVEGRVAQAEQAGRTRGLAHLGLELTTIHTSDGQTVTIQTAKFEQLGTTSKTDDWTRVGIGTAIGGAIGAAAGGGKGAAIGGAAGAAAGAGTAAAARGRPAEIAVETRIGFRLQQPVMLTEKLP